uniref:Uncharacterized protein n=1 Tax=Arion vulgaris TaxID=1028688 RepID=A0A0B6YHR0_9EUPU
MKQRCLYCVYTGTICQNAYMWSQSNQAMVKVRTRLTRSNSGEYITDWDINKWID